MTSCQLITVATLAASCGQYEQNEIQNCPPTDLTLDVVAITQATKLLLASCVPYVKFNGASVSMEHQGMDFNTKRC